MTKFGDPDFSYHISMSTILGLCILRLSEYKLLPFSYTPYSNSLYEYMEDFSVALAASPLSDSVSMDPLWNVLKEYEEASKTFDQEAMISDLEGKSPDYLNKIMLQTESCFLDQNGIPGRPWYKHIVFAPDEWSGYRAKLFPSLHEALSSGSLEAVNSAITTTLIVLEKAVSCLKI